MQGLVRTKWHAEMERLEKRVVPHTTTLHHAEDWCFAQIVFLMFLKIHFPALICYVEDHNCTTCPITGFHLLLQSQSIIISVFAFHRSSPLFWFHVTLCRAKQQSHVPSSSPNSNLAEVLMGVGWCCNTGYISANMILACNRDLMGALIVRALTQTSTWTYLPHHFCRPTSPLCFFVWPAHSVNTRLWLLPLSLPAHFPISG